MIVLDKLLRYRVPEATQRLSAKDAALYALSIGVGQDPMDERQLRYVSMREDQEVLPFMAVVLAHPGFWMADPATGIDASRIVHGEQSMEFHARLPLEGTVQGSTRIEQVLDKGPGRGALLYMRKELVAEDGRPLASLRSTLFLRGNGGFGGPSGPVPATHVLPDREPDHHVELKTRPEQALLYRLNGDLNPLHSDPAAATRAGFERPILHGLCTLGLCGHAVLAALCDYRSERLRALSLRFTSPVYPGETIAVDLWSDGSFRARVPERGVTVIDKGKADLA